MASSDIHVGGKNGRAMGGTAVVIVNWRAPAMTIEAVQRVLEQSVQPRRIYVVDNGSGDDSYETLRRGLVQHAQLVTLLANPDNLGFGGGCNAALRAILAEDFDYCWLLNNDAVPDPGCLDRLIACAERTPNVGAIGSCMIDPAMPGHGHYGSWLNSLTLGSHEIDDPAKLDGHKFAWLTAASLLVSVPALRDIGTFDEQFFMYWEDADLSMRLRANGYRLAAAPDAHVMHAAGTSSEGMKTRRYLWHFNSHRIWLRKHSSMYRIMVPLLRAKYLLKAMIDRDLPRMQALLRA